MNHTSLNSLRNQITGSFNLNELNSVLADCHVNHEDVSGQGLSGKVRESVDHFRRHSRLHDFVQALASHKPTIDWTPWGGPPAQLSVAAVLRQMLDAAYSSSELNTLAFDLFSDIQADIAHHPKSRKVTLIAQAAIQRNAIHSVAQHVRQNNPHQYGRYFNSLDNALQTQQSEPAFIVATAPPSSPQRDPSSTIAELRAALRYYANGGSDNGRFAQQTLEALSNE